MGKITICGSMKFFDEMKKLKEDLENKDFVICVPTLEGTGVDYSKLTQEEQANIKQYYIDEHIKKIKSSDAILVANYTKNDIKDYIGGNTFIEIAFAYILEKKIFILNTIPEQNNSLEIAGMKPIILHGDIARITIN